MNKALDTEKETKVITFSVPCQIHDELKFLSYKHKTTISNLCRDGVAKVIDEYNVKKEDKERR